jgi:hypothetical protein
MAQCTAAPFHKAVSVLLSIRNMLSGCLSFPSVASFRCSQPGGGTALFSTYVGGMCELLISAVGVCVCVGVCVRVVILLENSGLFDSALPSV